MNSRTEWQLTYASINRSTKSEKLYPSMMQRSDELEPLYSIPYNLASVHNLINVNYSGQDEPPSPTPSHLSQEAFVGNGGGSR